MHRGPAASKQRQWSSLRFFWMYTTTIFVIALKKTCGFFHHGAAQRVISLPSSSRVSVTGCASWSLSLCLSATLSLRLLCLLLPVSPSPLQGTQAGGDRQSAQSQLFMGGRIEVKQRGKRRVWGREKREKKKGCRRKRSEKDIKVVRAWGKSQAARGRREKSERGRRERIPGLCSS